MKKSLLLLFPILIFANDPSTAYLDLFYQEAVQQTHDSVLGATATLQKRPLEPILIDDFGFSSQHFVLWDFSEDAPTNQSYYDTMNLVKETYIKNLNYIHDLADN